MDGRVVPLIPKRRQRWRSGSGLSGSEQRRGDLWKSQERHPVVPRGRSEAELDTSEKATSSTGGSEFSLERAGVRPAGGPWRGAREDRDNLRTGGSEARALQTPAGLVSRGVASTLQEERGSVEMTHGGDTRRSL